MFPTRVSGVLLRRHENFSLSWGKGCALEGVDFGGDNDGNEHKIEVGEAWNIEDDIYDSNDKGGKLHL